MAGPAAAPHAGAGRGDPLFVAELGPAYQNAAPWRKPARTSRGQVRLDLRATGLDEMIRAHLDQLDQPTRDVLDALAVWGADIAVAELAQLLAAPAAAPPTATQPAGQPLEQAIGSGLVRREPSGTVSPARSVL